LRKTVAFGLKAHGGDGLTLSCGVTIDATELVDAEAKILQLAHMLPFEWGTPKVRLWCACF
jgi:hypothetical protein